jgi:hypothetical protein
VVDEGEFLLYFLEVVVLGSHGDAGVHYFLPDHELVAMASDLVVVLALTLPLYCYQPFLLESLNSVSVTSLSLRAAIWSL